jgi:hypothetical protein
MARPIVLPDNLYQRIHDLAASQGQTPDQLMAFLAEAYVLEHPAPLDYGDIPGYDPAQDPLAPFVGKGIALVPDLTLRHDFYLAEEASDPHDNE